MEHNRATVKPASPRLVAGFLAVGLVGVLAFGLLLHGALAAPHGFKAEGFSAELPENVAWAVEPSVEKDVLVVDGWALELGRHIEKVEIWVLLYDDETGEYLRLPSALVLREELYTAFDSGPRNYASGGFMARVKLARLPKEPGAYEICLAFSHNQLNLLVHTGEAAA